MKKIELHLHLEGAAPPAFIRSLAKEKRVDLPRLFNEQGDYTYRNFAEFLRLYESVTGLLTTPRDYARLLEEVLIARAEDGVLYTELFVSPDFCGGGDVFAWRDHLAAMEEVALKMQGHGIESRAIATAICRSRSVSTPSRCRAAWLRGIPWPGPAAATVSCAELVLPRMLVPHGVGPKRVGP